jgi:hypothetical protein
VKLHSFLSSCALTDITLSLYQHFPDVPSKLNASMFAYLNEAPGNDGLHVRPQVMRSGTDIPRARTRRQARDRGAAGMRERRRKPGPRRMWYADPGRTPSRRVAALPLAPLVRPPPRDTPHAAPPVTLSSPHPCPASGTGREPRPLFPRTSGAGEGDNGSTWFRHAEGTRSRHAEGTIVLQSPGARDYAPGCCLSVSFLREQATLLSFEKKDNKETTTLPQG